MRVPPEELRAAASDLLQLSGEVSHVQRAVRHHWGRLDAGWQSYARAGVDAQYEETVREIDRMALMLEQLGAALVKTADIIEAADRDAAAFFTVEEAQMGGGKAPGLAKLMPDGAPLPPWKAIPNKMWDLIKSFPTATMYVTSTDDGLNLRRTPGIPEDNYEGNRAMADKIPEGAKIRVHPIVPTREADNYEWCYVTYTDAEGNEYSGWVATAYLGKTKSGEGTSEDASTTPTPTPVGMPEPITVPSTGPMPVQTQNDNAATTGQCVDYALVRRPELGSPGGGAAGYIQKFDADLIGDLVDENTDLTTIIASGYAIVWTANHPMLGGYDQGYGHVAIVKSVYPDHIVVKHANFNQSGESEIYFSDDPKKDLRTLHMIGPIPPIDP